MSSLWKMHETPTCEDVEGKAVLCVTHHWVAIWTWHWAISGSTSLHSFCFLKRPPFACLFIFHYEKFQTLIKVAKGVLHTHSNTDIQELIFVLFASTIFPLIISNYRHWDNLCLNSSTCFKKKKKKTPHTIITPSRTSNSPLVLSKCSVHIQSSNFLLGSDQYSS